MPNYGLSALSGIFKGLEGFPEGLIAGGEAQRKQEVLDALERERQRHAQSQAETLGLRREELAGTERRHRETTDLQRLLGMLPYTTPKAVAPPIPAPFSLTPGQRRFTPEGKLVAEGGIKEPTPGESVHAARQRVSAAWAGGQQPDPTDLNLVNLASQVTSVPNVGAFPKTEAVQPVMPPALKGLTGPSGPRQPTIPAMLSPEGAGALGVPYGTTAQQAAGARPLTAAQRTKLDAQNASLAIVDNMEQQIQAIAQAGTKFPTGPLERIRAIPRTAKDVYLQANPQLVRVHRQVEGTLALIVRSLGEVGTLTDGDIERARSLMPTFAPIPDTEAVIRQKIEGLRQLIREVVSRTGTRPAPTTQYERDPQGQLVPVR